MMKRYGTLLQLTTCLALGGTVMVLWLCVLIGFGIHTTVGKEGIYLWLLLQAVRLPLGCGAAECSGADLGRHGGASFASGAAVRRRCCFPSAWRW